MTTLPPVLDPLLIPINTHFNNAGIQQGKALIFYTTKLAYKVYVYDYKYFVTRVSRSIPPYLYPEVIPLLDSGGESDVFAILSQEPVWLTQAQVTALWGHQNWCEVNVNQG